MTNHAARIENAIETLPAPPDKGEDEARMSRVRASTLEIPRLGGVSKLVRGRAEFRSSKVLRQASGSGPVG